MTWDCLTIDRGRQACRALGEPGVGSLCEDMGICQGDMLDNWISMRACAMGICSTCESQCVFVWHVACNSQAPARIRKKIISVSFIVNI